MDQPTNLVEAGFNDKGQSAILQVKKINRIHPIPEMPSFSVTNLYYVNQLPVTTQTQNDNSPYNIDLPPNTLRFLICRIPSINTIIKEMNNPSVKTPEDYLKIGMHRTPSVDYFYVSKGAVTVYMSNGDTYNLKEGDAYAMRGADHAWVNYSDSLCELVGVMLGVAK